MLGLTCILPRQNELTRHGKLSQVQEGVTEMCSWDRWVTVTSDWSHGSQANAHPTSQGNTAAITQHSQTACSSFMQI